MAQGKANSEQLSREELALMAAFEARTGDGTAGVDTATLSPEMAAELADFVALTEQIDALDDVPPVDPAIRGRLLSAAVAHREAAAEPKGLAAWLLALLRPGPMAAVGLGFAVLVAFIVRPSTQRDANHAPGVTAHRGGAAMVAMDRAESGVRDETTAGGGPHAGSAEAAKPQAAPAAAGSGPTGRAGQAAAADAAPTVATEPPLAARPRDQAVRAERRPPSALAKSAARSREASAEHNNPSPASAHRRVARRRKLFAARPASLGPTTTRPSTADAPARAAKAAPSKPLMDRLATAQQPRGGALDKEADLAVATLAKPRAGAPRGAARTDGAVQAAAEAARTSDNDAAAGAARVAEAAERAAAPQAKRAASAAPAPSRAAPAAKARPTRAASAPRATTGAADTTQLKQLRRRIERTKSVVERRTLLKKLMKLAKSQGQQATAQWAKRQLAALPKAPTRAKAQPAP